MPAEWAVSLGWLAVAWLAALMLTAGDWAAMARQWLGVSAYQHILFVPPIIGWLAWNRRGALADMVPHAWWPGTLGVLGALAMWLVGSLTSLDIVAQAGAVLLLQTITVTLLGPRIGAVLLFPLFFAVFLVPFGEEIVAPLQMLTAEMVITLTHWSGIPAEIDGVFIATPAGLFEVAEACAGVQFVMAMVTLGVLAAKIGMASWPRRIAFMALCVIVPILANGVRAWGIVAIAQVVGTERAGGVDHIVYGWFFFAIVVALVMALAWRWFERDPHDEADGSARLAAHPMVDRIDRLPASASTLAPIVVALILLTGLWGGLARASEAEPAVPTSPQLRGWTELPAGTKTDWQPKGAGASQRLHTRYRDGAGNVVDLYIAGYRGQGDPTAGGEGAVPPDTAWRHLAPITAPAGMRGEQLLAYGTQRRIAWTSFVAHGGATDDPLVFRLTGLGDRLALRADPRWLVIMSAPDTANGEGQDVLRRFRDASGDPAALVQRALSR